MDVSAVVGGASASDAASLTQQASVAVLKKSLDAEQSAALELIQSISAPNPPHLGQNVDLLA